MVQTGFNGVHKMPDFFESIQYARPFICSDSDSVSLHFNINELQSLMSIRKPHQLEIPYTKTMMGFLLVIPNPVHILMIGLGGGSLAKFCYLHLPNTRITVVEINPHVIALRKRFLIPDDDERLNIVFAEGAEFVRDARQTFDVILVDGFDAQGQSTKLSSRAFYEDCCRVLLPKGVMVANLDSAHPAHTLLVQRIYKTYQGNSVEIVVEDRDNHVVFAVKNIPISSRWMSLSWSLGHHSVEAQLQLKQEFQRILRILGALEQQGPQLDGTSPLPLH